MEDADPAVRELPPPTGSGSPQRAYGPAGSPVARVLAPYLPPGNVPALFRRRGCARKPGQLSSWSVYEGDYSSWVDQSGQEETAAPWMGTTSRGETATE
jgi:hypothetical protein